MSGPVALRRRLLALTRPDRRRLGLDRVHGGARLLADPFTTIVELPLGMAERRTPQLAELDHGDALVPGAVFVRNLFAEGRYVDLRNARLHITQSKYDAVTRICQLLGARYVAVRADVSDTDKHSTHVGASVSATKLPDDPAVEGPDNTASAQFGAEGRMKASEGYELRVEFSGGSSRIDEALEYLRRMGLDNEPTLRHLIALRRDDENHTRMYRLTLDMMREAKMEYTFGVELRTGLRDISLHYGGLTIQLGDLDPDAQFDISRKHSVNQTTHVHLEVGFA